MSLSGLLNQRVTLQRATEVLSITGAATRSWSVIASSVPIRIEHGPGRQVPADPGRVVDADATAFCGIELDIIEGDRVLDGAKTYDVLLVVEQHNPLGPRGDHRELTLALAPPDA